MSDTQLKTLDPFAMPALADIPELPDEKLDQIGAKNGFETAPQKTANAARKPSRQAKPRPRKKEMPKPVVPEVRRMRTADAKPKAQFNQRVTVDTANGFYDYQRATGLPMWKVMERAYKALTDSEKGA